MNFENNNSKNESLELSDKKDSIKLPAEQDSNSDISERELSDLRLKDEEATHQEMFKIRESIKAGDSDGNQETYNYSELKMEDGETEFDFLGRLSKILIDKQEDQDNKNNPSENKKIVKLLKKKNYQIEEVYHSEDNKEIIKKAFIEATKSINHKKVLNNDSNISCLDNINISSSSRNMNWDLNENSEHEDRVDFFSETNQGRPFFPSHYKKDGIYYSGSLFNVHSNSPEAREYLKNKLDGKVIYLLGGGRSANDLLQDTQINPRQIVNIDPFISEEDIERNKKGLYESISERADSKNLMEEIDSKKIELADEIWASYSVPFYNESAGEIDNLFSNIKRLLKEGGNCRITPISTQNEQAKQAMLYNLKQVVDSKEYNIHADKDTLIIHKLEKKD